VTQPCYQRILVKLSGEALMGDQGFGICPRMLKYVAEEVLSVHRLGVQVAIVVGGGNIFRGIAASSYDMDRASADHMGMLATVINSLALQDALAHSGVTTRVQTAAGPFSADYLVEVSRGCPHGCRFCAAGYVYRPARFHSLEALLACLDAVPPGTRRIGLVGAAVSDLPDLDALCRQAHARGMSLGFSSFRVDAISDALLEALVRSRVKTATIAPETGSQRLRDAINKHLGEAAILAAVERLVSAGIPNLKLYFMIGLPEETEADVAAIVTLVHRIKDRFLAASRPRGRMGTIRISLNPFVPKPFTPLQWAAMDSPNVLKAKIRRVREGLGALANVRLSAGKARLAFSQAWLARGDRRIGEVLRLRWQRGDPGWAASLDAAAMRLPWPLDAPLPWEVIDHGTDRAYLQAEYGRYRQAMLSPPCPPSGCRRCGVCGGQDA